MPVLETIVQKLDITPDVAGATFMAVGTSAPEFFTSIIGIFVFKNDVGIGTIFGSNILNHFIIIGFSALFSSKPLFLSWFPFIRDSTFYVLALLFLFIIVGLHSPDIVEWWEALLLLVLFGFYVLAQKYSSILEAKWDLIWHTSTDSPEHLHQRTRGATFDSSKITSVTLEDVSADLKVNKQDEEEGVLPEPWPVARGAPLNLFIARVVWIFIFPFAFMMGHTVPSVRDSEGRSSGCRVTASFVMSVFWIALLSYFMVDWATTVGITFGVSPLLMGLTVLAFGTSVPDTIASVIAARQGQGDQAVSNAVGSCVFNMLVGLGFPWLVAALTYGEPFKIDTEAFEINLGINLLASFVLSLSFGATKNVIHRKTGVFLVLCYLCFCFEEVYWDKPKF